MQESITQLVARLSDLYDGTADKLDPAFAAEAGDIIAQLVERTGADTLKGEIVPRLAAALCRDREAFVQHWLEKAKAKVGIVI